MREHDALGDAGRAAGVLLYGDVLLRIDGDRRRRQVAPDHVAELRYLVRDW
jgi:hypothetical protein